MGPLALLSAVAHLCLLSPVLPRTPAGAFRAFPSGVSETPRHGAGRADMDQSAFAVSQLAKFIGLCMIVLTCANCGTNSSLHAVLL